MSDVLSDPSINSQNKNSQTIKSPTLSSSK